VKTEDDIKAEIKKAIIDQKFRVELTKQMDEYLESAKKSLHVQIPNSIKEKEFVARMENMKKRFGGEEKWNGYVQQVGQAEIDKINEEVRQATHVSLEKYFLFQKIAELLDLKDIDWNKEFDAEMKMYNLLQK
jgi:FKBP-type peptidyl-prolyl cis-trans isomerase (trigger factor)